MANKKTIIGIIIVLAASLYAVWPLFGSGFIPTHDGEYHLIRFFEFDRMLRAGYLFPRWAPTVNSGYGLPLFEFMYPLINYIAVVFHSLGLSFVSTFKISSAVAYLLSGMLCFLWLKTRFGNFAAVIGALASAFVPYWFVNLYVRGAIGESWALVFVYGALYGIETGAGGVITVSIALLILSHNILAMIFFPIILAYLLWRKRWNYIWNILMGVCLAAWFWLPALAESRYMQGLNTVTFSDHFASIAELLIPSWGTEFSGRFSGNKMSFQIGIGPMLWLLIAFVFAIRTKLIKKKKEIFTLLIVSATIAFLMLPESGFLWNIIRPLRLIQYPWRFLVLFIPVTGYLVSFVSHGMKTRWLPVAILLVSIAVVLPYTRGAVYAPRSDSYYLSRVNFTDGTSSLGNALSTVWTGWKETRPAAGLLTTDDAPLEYSILRDQYLRKQYRVNLSKRLVVRIPVVYFPGWVVTIDGKAVAVDYLKNGTLDFTVPQGEHVLTAALKETPIRILSDTISLASLAVCVFWGILGAYAYRNRRNSARVRS